MGSQALMAMLANAATGAATPPPADYPRQPNGDPDFTRMTQEQMDRYMQEQNIPKPAPSPTPTPPPAGGLPQPPATPAPGPTPTPTPSPSPPVAPAEEPGILESIFNYLLKGTSANELKDDSQEGGALSPEELERRRQRGE